MQPRHFIIRAVTWMGLLILGVLSLPGQSTNFVYDPPGNLTGVSPSGPASISITAQPLNQVLSAAGNAYFSVVVSGTGPIGYQWLSNGVVIAGATGDSFVVPSIAPPVNLVSNGGFELPELLTTTGTFATGTNMGGWTVESNSVSLARSSSWQPFDGLQSLELNGTLPGAIYQDVPTVSNQQYYLRFELAGIPASAPVTKTNQVWWGTTLLDTATFSTAGATTLDMNWTNREYLVTASSNFTRIRVLSATAGANGPVVDGVSLIPLQQPLVNYSVIVSNAAGSITSSVVQVEFDSDGNDLPDDWERAYFGKIQQDPNADSDGDGISNLDEFRDGTNPTNAASFRPRLTYVSTPGGSIAAAPFQSSYTLNDTVQLIATPDAGALFNMWQGGVSGTNPIVNLLVSGNKTVIALFGFILTNGASYDGTLNAGASNRYAFVASGGDSIQLRVGASGFVPRIDLYDPNGTLTGQFAANNTGYRDASVFVRLTNSGIYSAVVASFFANGAGTYTVGLARVPGAYVVSPGHAGGTLTNGTTNPGAIAVGGQDMWSFTGNAGDSIQLRVGTVGFTPRIDLYGPDGSLAGQFAANNSGYRDGSVFLRLTNSGTFTAVVSSYFINGAGTYTLSLAETPESFNISPGYFGGALTNGTIDPGNIVVGGQDMWSFTGSAGDSIQLRVGSVGFTPRIDLYGPDGSLAGQFAANNSGYRDADVFLRLTNNGTYTAVVSSYFINGTGPYTISLGQAPDAFVISPGHSGGVLTNGVNVAGATVVGGQDLWTFTGVAGDSVQLRVGAADFTPRIDLYGPDGSLAAQFAVNSSGYHDALISLHLTNSGPYTAVVSSYFLNDFGDYNISLAQVPEAFVVSPGHAGGTLTNGATYTGTIVLGGQEMWTFNSNPGDRVQLRMGSDAFTPQMTLYASNGSLVGQYPTSSSSTSDGSIFVQLTNGGSYTLVASSYTVNGAGNYTLNLALGRAPFVVSPGDEGGPMTNGASYVSIMQLADQDMWSFTANAGDSIQLRVGTAGFTPRIDLYGPGGELTGEYAVNNSSLNDGWLDLRLTNSGTFVAVVSSFFLNESGLYYLNLAQAPEPFVVPPLDEGGALANGGNHDGVTALGDEDLWSFSANAGDSILLRCGELSGTSGYAPSLRLYGPTGALLTNDANASDALINYHATNSGTFTLMVDSSTANNTGNYRLRFMHIPGTFVVPAGDEGGTIAPGATNDAAIDLGDEDPWTFTAFKGVPITLSAQKLSGTAGFSPWLLLYDQNGALMTNASSATTATINYTPPNNGVFTLLIGSLNRGATGTYRLTSTGISSGVKMSSPVISGTNINLMATGGSFNQNLVLLSSTNLTLPAALWTPMLTNHFDASGNFVTSNLFNPAQPVQYFRLSLP